MRTRPPIDLFGSFVKGVTGATGGQPDEQPAPAPTNSPAAAGLDAVMKMLASAPQGTTIGNPSLIKTAGGSLGALLQIIARLEGLGLVEQNDGMVRLTTAGLAAAAAVTA